MPPTGEFVVTCFVVGCAAAAITAGLAGAALAAIIRYGKEKTA